MGRRLSRLRLKLIYEILVDNRELSTAIERLKPVHPDTVRRAWYTLLQLQRIRPKRLSEQLAQEIAEEARYDATPTYVFSVFNDWSLWQPQRTSEPRVAFGEGLQADQTKYWLEHPREFYEALEAYRAVLLARSFDVGSEVVHPPRKLMTRLQEDAIDIIRYHQPKLAALEDEFHSDEDGGDSDLAQLSRNEIERFLDQGIALLSEPIEVLPSPAQRI